MAALNRCISYISCEMYRVFYSHEHVLLSNDYPDDYSKLKCNCSPLFEKTSQGSRKFFLSFTNKTCTLPILPSPNNKRQRYEIYGLRTLFKPASNMPLSVHGKIAQLHSLVKLQEILAFHHRHYHNAPSEHYHVLPRDYRAGSCGMRREFHSIT